MKHKINVVGLSIDKRIADDFQRGRTVSQLREQFPHLPVEFLAQMAAPIGDLEQPFTDNFRLDQNDEKSARIGARKSSDGKKDTRVSMGRRDGFEEDDVRRDDVQQEERATIAPIRTQSDEIYHLTKEDVELLKPVPLRAKAA